MGDIVPSPLAVANSSWVKVVCSVSPVRGTRVLDGVSSPRPDSVDSATLCARTLLGATPIAQPDYTLPLRTTGPAAVRTSAIDARRRGQCASVSRHHNLVSERLEIAGGRGRETRISVLETSDVELDERNAVKRTSDLNSEL